MNLTLEDLDDALAGEPRAVRLLVDTLSPVLHMRVARVLTRRRASAPGRDVRQEIEDLVQEIFLLLFDDDGRVLRSWDPEKGLSLVNFVGLVAERQTITRLRSPRANPWTEDPTADADLDGGVDAHTRNDPETRAISRDTLRVLVERLRLELSPLGLEIFILLHVKRKAIDDVCAELRMNRAAVYVWRSRLRKKARTLAAQLDAELLDPRVDTRIPRRGQA